MRQIRKQGKGRSSKRKENRRLSFLFAPAAGAANSRAPQSATPRWVGVEKGAARTERIADATRVPRIIGADKNKKSPRCGDFRKKPAPDGTGSSFKLK